MKQFVLWIEDDRKGMEVIRRALEKRGYEIDFVSEYEEAKTRMRRMKKEDILFVDNDLPGWASLVTTTSDVYDVGAEFVAQDVSKGLRVKTVIILTSYMPEAGVVARIRKGGMPVHVINKIGNGPPQLINMVVNACEGPHD